MALPAGGFGEHHRFLLQRMLGHIEALDADMSGLPTAGHLCSWAKYSPGIKSSAGPRRVPILRTTYRDADYLVALAGQAPWVKHVRAARARGHPPPGWISQRHERRQAAKGLTASAPT